MIILSSVFLSKSLSISSLMSWLDDVRLLTEITHIKLTANPQAAESKKTGLHPEKVIHKGTVK